ncbi:DUF1538 domain-containing protein [Anaerocolumna sp.]|uniref:DUF1538 domain-containing protein n=1 Tax=Anaerocolumna sp. TaxID=2041569 RepID=UPI0028A96E4D|nr:DUF1538 domain-containing protein [Anaerocolumna sp.]
MNKKFLMKLKESLTSVLPITLLVLLLHFTIVPMSFGTVMMFIIGSLLLIIGMGLFTLGTDVSMMFIGERIGSYLAKSGKIKLLVILGFFMGLIITIAEPDLQVLAKQTPGVPDMVIILAVALGVGLFLVIALLRTLFQIKLSVIFIVMYGLVFLLAAFVPADFIPVAFDSGGVTTGPMTVPFIMALGIGMASLRSDKNSQEDSFGLVALCSVGPILAVLLLGIFFKPGATEYAEATITEINSFSAVLKAFLIGMPMYFKEVAMALLPIIAFFIIFQIFKMKLPKKQVLKIIIGLLYTYLGLVFFLSGANIGFMPAGSYLGSELLSGTYQWLIIPLGMLIGFFIVAAEPAVHVLKEQVEDISEGNITGKSMQLSLSIGVAVSVGLSMLRVSTGLSIWYLIIPGYLIALTLTFFVPSIFTAIAFDSGGVASGPMTATFLLPLAMGACEAVGGNILSDAFGTVAMVAMTPLITIQGLGLLYKFRTRRSLQLENDTYQPELLLSDEIIYFDTEERS